MAPSGERVILHEAERGEAAYATAFYVRGMIGEGAAGAWRLEVTDIAPGVSGEVVEWSMFVTT